MSENNTKNSFGATSWDIETSNGFKKNTNNKDLYLRLQDGNNVVRIVSRPHEYSVFKSFKPDPKAPGYGVRVLSSAFHGRDPLAEAPWNLKPSRRWLVYVIDRSSQSLKLLDISKSVFDGIRELVRDDSWGDTLGYDINIKVNKNAGGAVGYYTVIPKSKSPLSPADLELKQNMDLDDLKRRCTPPSPEDVDKKIAAIIAKSGFTAPTTTNAVVQNAAVESNDEDFDFPVVSG